MDLGGRATAPLVAAGAMEVETVVAAAAVEVSSLAVKKKPIPGTRFSEDRRGFSHSPRLHR